MRASESQGANLHVCATAAARRGCDRAVPTAELNREGRRRRRICGGVCGKGGVDGLMSNRKPAAREGRQSSSETSEGRGTPVLAEMSFEHRRTWANWLNLESPVYGVSIPYMNMYRSGVTAG